jgi:hypothetical protein
MEGEEPAAVAGAPPVSEYKIIVEGKEVGSERLERGEFGNGAAGGRWAKATSNVTLFDTIYSLTQEMRFDGRGELVFFSLVGSMGKRRISRQLRVENGLAEMDFDGEKTSRAFVPTGYVASDETLASMNALLLERTMKNTGRRFIVPLLPQGKARINRRGEDVFQVEGKEVRAIRFFETDMTTKGSFAWLLPSGEMLVTTGTDAKAFVVLAGYQAIVAEIPGIVSRDLEVMQGERTPLTPRNP